MVYLDHVFSSQAAPDSVSGNKPGMYQASLFSVWRLFLCYLALVCLFATIKKGFTNYLLNSLRSTYMLPKMIVGNSSFHKLQKINKHI